METLKSTTQAIRPVIHLAVACFMMRFAYYTTVPFMVDVMLPAICPGQTECSQVIIMMSAQQVVVGIGAILTAPVLGSLSDNYGRKPVLMALSIGNIIPTAILAYSRTKSAVYGWWLVRIIVSIMRDGSLTPAVLAYVADVVDETNRATAIGMTTASLSLGSLLGTLTTYLIDTGGEAFVAATIFETSAALYFTLFVKETNPRQPLLSTDAGKSQATTTLLMKPEFKRQTTNIRETAKMVWTSPRLRIISLVEFMYIFISSGLTNFTWYYLRAAFLFDKDQYATVELVTSGGTTLGQMFMYPIASYVFGQRGVLWIGLLGSAAYCFIYSSTWSPWLPYVAVAMGVFMSLIEPTVGTISSRGVDSEQQGKLQGVMSSIKSTARVIAPLVLTPLTAAALGDHPPLHMRGFPFLVCGIATLLVWLVSLRLPYIPISEELDRPIDYIQAPMSSEDFIDETTPFEDLLCVDIRPKILKVIDLEQDDKITIAQAQ